MNRAYISFSDLPPQEQTILRHLLTEGDITAMEAIVVHRCRSVSRRVTTLVDAGVRITKQDKTDATGQRYRKYVLDHCPMFLCPKEFIPMSMRSRAYA